MPSATWRGTIGLIKPTYESGSLVEFIKLLPEGIGVIPLYMGLQEHTEREYLNALEVNRKRVEELANLGVDLIFPGGAPPFLIRGYRAEQDIVKSWEDKYNVPIVTPTMTQTAAFRALGMEKFFGLTFQTEQRLNDMFTTYFRDAGFDVAAMESMPLTRAQRKNVSTEEMYLHIKRFFLKYPSVDGIYLQGSGPGTWRVKDVVRLEEDLGIPVVHPTAARVWSVQKRLHVRAPIQGASRLLELMP
jgi:maleate cis-trans isomerase